ncbi:MAG: AAA family ATPase [Hyphomicrobiales bacterium]|nr:AAA family ATPase [Hyphomicrobiales bacterium]
MTSRATSPEERSQEAVFALLADPATHGGAAVRRIDTHAASVFLAGERAYKVKRAVRFPFLDYSTRARRRAACEQELAVNRPFAPDIYRRVAAITRESDGRLALDGRGEPVDWAVEMRRFDEQATLDHLAAAGRIDVALADALGRAVAAAHATTPAAESPARWIAALAEYIDQNDAALRDYPALFAATSIDALTAASRAALARLQPLLAERGRRGLIRRGHGDLHLGNIVLIDGQPMLFDAIEFDPLIASGDLLYDLAFLLMDLVERDLPAAANTVLNRYLLTAGRNADLDALGTLPLFLSLRAAIRAKVTAARLRFADSDAHASAEASARNYFDLATRAIAPPLPMLVAIGGLSGTGKSQLARALAPFLAPAPGAVVLRSDVARKALLGRSELEQLPAEGYTPAVTARVYVTIADQARRVVAAGHSALVDAVFAKPQERALLRQSAQALGARCHLLFLEAPLEVRVARVGDRSSDASDADATVARAQAAYDLGSMDWTRIDAAGTPEETLARARATIEC